VFVVGAESTTTRGSCARVVQEGWFNRRDPRPSKSGRSELTRRARSIERERDAHARGVGADSSVPSATERERERERKRGCAGWRRQAGPGCQREGGHTRLAGPSWAEMSFLFLLNI
jgi:hypothetical protein